MQRMRVRTETIYIINYQLNVSNVQNASKVLQKIIQLIRNNNVPIAKIKLFHVLLQDLIVTVWTYNEYIYYNVTF